MKLLNYGDISQFTSAFVSTLLYRYTAGQRVNDMHQVEILDARTFSDADARAIAELLVKVWPKPGKTVEFRQQQMLDMGQGFQGPDSQAPRSSLIRENGRVIAHAALIPRTVGTTSGELTIAGLARVCTDPDYRGQGLGELVVRAIFDAVDDGSFPFAFFQTNTRIQPFYEKFGACLATNPVINSFAQDMHDPFWDEIKMRYPKDGDWPEGPIDLRGPGY
jgi:predicted N-acetyltransferase YhbS